MKVGLVGVVTVRVSEYGPQPTPLIPLILYSRFLPSEKIVVVVWLLLVYTKLTVLVISVHVPSVDVKPVVQELKREYEVE